MKESWAMKVCEEKRELSKDKFGLTVGPSLFFFKSFPLFGHTSILFLIFY